MVDNVRMADLDPVPVLEAVAGDPQLRVFVGDGRIQALPAKQSRRLADFLSRANGEYWRSGGTVLPTREPEQAG
jgi:hypothetical protein